MDLNNEIGKRIRNIRLVFNEGGKLTANQFGFLLKESGDKIRNYELGRTPISPRVLYSLYKRGINPIYIISGEGSMFADTKAGREFAGRLSEHTGGKAGAKVLELADGSADGGGSKFTPPVYKVAAGRINKKNKKK